MNKRLQVWMIWLPSACAIITILFWLPKNKSLPRQEEQHHNHTFSIIEIERKSLDELSEEDKMYVEKLYKDTASNDKSLQALSSFWSSEDSTKVSPLLFFYYSYRYALKGNLPVRYIASRARLMTLLALQTKDKDIHNTLLEWSSQLLTKALLLAPYNDSLLVDHAAMSLWYISDTEKNYPSPMKAIAKLKSIIEINPEQSYALYMLGTASMVSNQFDKAIDYFQRVLQVEPDSHNAIVSLADAYQSQGDNKKAAYWYNKANHK